MTALGHRSRVLLLALLLALLALLLFTRPTHAGWGVDPVEVHATAARCPLVAASDDAHAGAIVVWQEATVPGGVLMANHLLSSGDVDPVWPGPVQLSSADVARVALGAVRDGVGGAYVWWMEGVQLYLTRVTPGGNVAAGWPARGRLMGWLANSSSRPVFDADGTGGVYAAWLSIGALLPVTTYVVRAHHLGPDNTAVGGWPAGGRGFLADGTMSSFGIGAASDGGLWLAFTTAALDDLTGYAPGEVLLRRLTSGGVAAPGWNTTGVHVDEFRADLLAFSPYWGLAPPMRLAAVEDDGTGGAFVLFGRVFDGGFGGAVVDYCLQRIASDGSVATGWPAGGVAAPPAAGLLAWSGQDAALSLRLHADATGARFAGRPSFFDHGVSYDLNEFTPTGALQGGATGGSDSGIESAALGGGVIACASYHPDGPYGFYSPNAFLSCQLSSGASFVEVHPEPVLDWYGDIGLTATGDGGAIFAWSQVRERFGVFAVRLNPAGPVTAVPPATSPTRLRAWFARGEGVRLAGAVGRVTLHDLTGRSVAGAAHEAGATAEWTLPGTAMLPSGMYFVRAVEAGRETRARVIVVR